MTGEEAARCPFCGGPIDAAAADEAAKLRQQIRALREQLHQLEERLYPVQHPPGLWGGYGGDDT